jgi:hypothetical protein
VAPGTCVSGATRFPHGLGQECGRCRGRVRPSRGRVGGRSRYSRAVRVVALGSWGTLAVFGAADARMPDVPSLPDWLPPQSAYRPARLTVHIWPDRTMDYIAVWPDGAVVPDPDGDAPWRFEQLDGVVLAQPMEHHRCFVCRRRVNAVYPAPGLPLIRSDRLNRHRRATHCPHCNAHVDEARLHALALFIPESDRG